MLRLIGAHEEPRLFLVHSQPVIVAPFSLPAHQGHLNDQAWHIEVEEGGDGDGV